MNAGGRFTNSDRNGIVCSAVNDLRKLRRPVGLAQREFASLLSVPLETLRTWDSGRRPVPAPVLHRATGAIARHKYLSELLPLDNPKDALLANGQ